MRGRGRKRLVLASASPRRRELMAAFVPSFEVIGPNGVTESRRPGETPEEYVLRLSRSKSRSVASGLRHAIVVGADTAVAVNGYVLGKPSSPQEASWMLQRLRGRAHRVVTGVTVLDTDSGRSRSAAGSTDVVVREYSQAEVAAYLASGQPFDKAGAYAIQDASFHPVERITGCYLNVVGLPLCQVNLLLAQIGAPVERAPDWRPPQECGDCPLRPGPEDHIR